jgi:hypothetical protein
MDFSMEMSIGSTVDSSIDSSYYTDSTEDFKVSDIAGFEPFTQYFIRDGKVYRFGKVKQWVGVNSKYVLLCQGEHKAKLYQSTIDNLGNDKVKDERKVSDISGYEVFTEYTIGADGNIYRFGKIKHWMGADRKFVQLSQQGNLTKLYKSTLESKLTGKSSEMWRMLSQPMVTEDDDPAIAKKMRKYLKGYRISNKGQIQRCVNHIWKDVNYGKYSSIYLPHDDDQFQIDKDDEDTIYEEDPKLETTQYSIRCLMEYFFDSEEIDLNLSILS